MVQHIRASFVNAEGAEGNAVHTGLPKVPKVLYMRDPWSKQIPRTLGAYFLEGQETTEGPRVFLRALGSS